MIDKDILKKVKEDELPEALRKLAPEKREAYVKDVITRRKEIQAKIGKLATEREAYLTQERKRLATESDDATLGDAVVSAIQKQLVDSGFEQK